MDRLTSSISDNFKDRAEVLCCPWEPTPIAELMGQMAEEVGPEFVLATGDVHHFEGVYIKTR